MENLKLDFEENGVKYHAEKGFAYAEKDGKQLWSALDVFRTTIPTRESVLVLNKIVDAECDTKGFESEF